MNDSHQKKTCRYCDTPLGPAFLEMGTMALANSYVKPGEATKDEFKCPLSLTRCTHCGLVQLTHVVPPDLMFKHYLYVSSTTQTFRDHFAAYAARVKSRVTPKEKPLAVDIGSNDGLLLACYEKEGMRAVGVDPAENLSQAANANGLVTLNRYFDAEAVREIRERFGPADAVSANNVFAHIDDIAGVCRNVSTLLDDQGIFSIEFPYLVTMMDQLLFDMIYHEHLSYIAIGPLQVVMNRFGFEIFDIEPVASHGGSLRVFAQKKGGGRPVAPIVGDFLEKEKARGLSNEAAYHTFARQVMDVKNGFMQKVAALKKAGKTLCGYGAPAKASTLINFYGLTPQDITYVVDDNPLKQGYGVPGAHIPIVPSARLAEKPADYVIIFAWNFAQEIMKKIGYLREKGVDFLIPVGKP